MLNWQTEDDPNWNDEPNRPPASQRPQRRRLKLLLAILLLLLLLGATAVVVARQFTQRVDDVNDLLIADIGASHATIEQAAQNQDADLFLSLLSGRSESWVEAQQRLAAAGDYFDRSDFGLASLAGPAEPAIELAPDLLSAVVTTAPRITVAPYPGRITLPERPKAPTPDRTAKYRCEISGSMSNNPPGVSER